MNVVVCGTWDLFHKGHEELLDYAYMMGDLVRIFVTSTEFVKGKKKPLQNNYERIFNVGGYFETINMCLIEDKEQFQQDIVSLTPCILLHGNDHNIETLSEIYGVEHNWWKDNDIYLLYKDRYLGISSSVLRIKNPNYKGFIR